jgi:hypothetical protein
MRRRFFATLAAATVAFGGTALAQGGDLRGVTMRVLDDLGDVDAVIIELNPGNSEGEDAARRNARGADAGEAQRAAADAAAKAGARFEEPQELHHPDDDERGEGRLEDRDVEQPAPAAP